MSASKKPGGYILQTKKQPPLFIVVTKTLLE
jgi:hypothetical protein